VDLNKTAIDFQPHKTAIKFNYREMPKIKLSGKDSFFHFGAGFGDEEVDNINYTEFVLDWDSDQLEAEYPFVEKFVIPGTSIKGALAHRTSFHYNKENGNFVENLIEQRETNTESSMDLSGYKLEETTEGLERQKKELKAYLKSLEIEQQNNALFDKVVGSNNEGVKSLFGKAKTSEVDTGTSGSIIIKDIYLPIATPQTIFYHNKIDRYTGGTIDSALFSERVLSIDEISLCIKYKEGIDLKYFEMALTDLKMGMLPLGGLVNKGHGVFVENNTTENEK